MANSYCINRHNQIQDYKIADMFGVDEDDEPVLLIVKRKGENEGKRIGIDFLKYQIKSLDEDFTKEKMDKWVKDFLFDKLKPEPISEGTPYEHPENSRAVVRRTWQKEVIDCKENVVVRMVNGDDVTASKIHENSWKLTLNEIKGEDRDKYNVKFVEIDSALNEIDGIEYGLTTIMIFPAGQKDKPLIYKNVKKEGETADDYEIINFLAEFLGISKYPRKDEKNNGNNKVNSENKEDSKSDL